MFMKKLKFYLRSVYYLIMRWIVRKDYLIAYVPEHHLRFKFKTEDVMGRLLYKYGTYESGITQCFLNNIPLEEHDVLLDVGANLGWYSLLFDKYSPPSVSIYAFEPDPLNFELLTTNVEKNKAHKITCVPKALSDKSETKTLYLYPSKNRGRHSLLPINSGEVTEVTTVTVDAFVKDHTIDPSRVKFVKIDVEGYEYFVLQGARSLLSLVPYLHTEYSPTFLQKGGVDAKEFVDFVIGYQFTPYVIDGHGSLYPIPYEQLVAYPKGVNLNILWVKDGYPVSSAV